MKAKQVILGIAVAAATVLAWPASAQSQPSASPAVKLIPLAGEGMLKLIYAYEANGTVRVKFIGSEGVLKSDRITASDNSRGFSKKYDLRNVREKLMWVEVSSPEMTVTYRLETSGTGWTSHLEEATYHFTAVAAR